MDFTKKIPYLCPISISGDVTQKERMREEISNLENLTQKHSGSVLRKAELHDGFFLEVSFNDKENLEKWKKCAQIVKERGE